jgi:hypothetical protein
MVQDVRSLGFAGAFVFSCTTFWDGVSTAKPAQTAAIRDGIYQSAVQAGVSVGADEDQIPLIKRVDGVHWAQPALEQLDGTYHPTIASGW